jgi:hypothetical protein
LYPPWWQHRASGFLVLAQHLAVMQLAVVAHLEQGWAVARALARCPGPLAGPPEGVYRQVPLAVRKQPWRTPETARR